MFRIGYGFDVHKIEQASESSILLGGVKVPSDYKVIAHSDGDVLLHAITDSLLGAMSMGDMGRHFPSTPENRGISSQAMMQRVNTWLRESYYEIHNIDATVIVQQPRLGPYIQNIQQTIATDLKIASNQVNVKAKTTDHVGFIGRREGIAVTAVTLIAKGKHYENITQ